MAIIYAITCGVTGDQYIGSTRKRLEQRWMWHKAQLRNGSHKSRLLRECANQYGIDSLSICALVEVPDTDRERVEISLIRRLQPVLNTYKYAVRPVLTPYDPEKRKRRMYLVGTEMLTMADILTKYGIRVVGRVQNGDRGVDALRPRYTHRGKP